MTPEEEHGAGSDELRRRLYRPGASQADVQRYVREQGTPPSSAAEPQPATGAPVRGRARAVVLPVVVAAAVVAGSFALLRATPAGDPAPSASPSSSTADLAARSALVPYGAVVPAATPVPTSVDGVEVTAQVFHGRSSSRIPLDTTTARRGGVMVVALSSSSGWPIGWRAVRPAADTRSLERTVASSTAALRPTPPFAQRVGYRGEPPVLMEISADAAATWTLFVAFVPSRH